MRGTRQLGDQQVLADSPSQSIESSLSGEVESGHSTKADALPKLDAIKSAASTKRETRFEFGRNWAQFLKLLDDERIKMARESLREMLGVGDLTGLTFLDAGSGSGLFSLAAYQLGAARVHSFDYDSQSVGCTQELRHRFAEDDDRWTIEQGDCLDREYVQSLPQFDVVYSWGVLHHTGAMWQAMENVIARVASNGQFFTSIYNDQRWKSHVWKRVKWTYCSSGLGKVAVCALGIPTLMAMGLVDDVLKMKNPLLRYTEHDARGMSVSRDWFDWLGGYPFEVARPEEVFEFCRGHGFQLERLRTVGGGWGCNEFVFRRVTNG